MSLPEATRVSRRDAIKWMLAASATIAISSRSTWAQNPAASGAGGYGTDPDLLKTHGVGDLWPSTFNDKQRRTAAILCDLIIPADEHSPSAAQLGVHDFIDEWISAPYPRHADDKGVVVEGLVWLDEESQRRFGKDFANSEERQRSAICDDLCHLSETRPEFGSAKKFFKIFRDLTAGGYFTTPEGMKYLQYSGNAPTATFDGPPPELLRKLDLA